MRNLDQIRAENALSQARPAASRPKFDKSAVNRLPSLVMSSGLLATAAFADERKEHDEAKRPEMKAAMDAVAAHLANRLIDKLPPGCDTSEAMIGNLKNEDSDKLIAATEEALAYLGYLKRFTGEG